MKNLFFCFLFIFPCLSYAQDLIVKMDGQEVPAKVEEITLEEIIYVKPDSLQGPVMRMLKSEVFMIKYANGTREVFSENFPGWDRNSHNGLTPEEMYMRGRRDGRHYYRGDGAMWGSAASSLIPLYGLIGPIIIAAVPPDIDKFAPYDRSLLLDPNYARGFKKQAHQRKVGKAATGAAIGTAVSVTTILLIFSAIFVN